MVTEHHINNITRSEDQKSFLLSSCSWTMIKGQENWREKSKTLLMKKIKWKEV